MATKKSDITKDKVLYIIFNILDFGLTYGGSAAVIVANYLQENSASYKLTLSGIILVVCLFFSCKHIYEKTYQRKLDNYLQDLASATNEDVKTEINSKINILKREQDIYDRLMIIMPFAIIYVITWLGVGSLESLHSTCGLIMIALVGGGVCNVIKKPYYENYKREKVEYKVEKKYGKEITL